MIGNTTLQRGFDALGEEWSLKRVGRQRDKNQYVEENKRDGNPTSPDALNSYSVNERTDEVNVCITL